MLFDSQILNHTLPARLCRDYSAGNVIWRIVIKWKIILAIATLPYMTGYKPGTR